MARHNGQVVIYDAEGRAVSRSKNLAGLIRHANNRLVSTINVSPDGVLSVRWEDGTHVAAPFADASVAVHWAKSRAWFKGVPVTRHNPAFGDYLAAGRRHLATGLTKAAEEAQRAAERARAAAEREASRRQCDAPTPEQALRVLAQAIGVAKLNPRRNGTIKMSSPRTTEAYQRLLIAEAGAPRGQAMSDWQRDATASDVRKGWLSHYGALPEWAKPARRARKNGGGFVCENDRYCPQPDTFASLADFQAMCEQVFGHRARLTRRGDSYVDEHGQVVLRPVASPRKNGWESHPWGWAKVQDGRVVKLSMAERKPKGTGWGAIETSSTKIGNSAYLSGGTVYLR